MEREYVDLAFPSRIFGQLQIQRLQPRRHFVVLGPASGTAHHPAGDRHRVFAQSCRQVLDQDPVPFHRKDRQQLPRPGQLRPLAPARQLLRIETQLRSHP